MWAIGFGVGIAYWPGLLSAAVTPRWALLAAGIPFISRLDPRALDPVVGAVLCALLAWAGLSILWTPDRLTGAHEFFHLLILGAVALAVANAGGARSAIEGAAWALAVNGVVALAQVTGWSGIGQATPPPAGLFLNRDMLAEFAAPLVVWLVAQRQWVLVLLGAVPLVLCESRVALVAAAVGLVSILPWRRALALGILAVLGMLVLGTLPFGALKMISAGERWQIWGLALSDPRFFGHGLGGFTAAFPGWEYAHGELFQAIYELGLGAALLVGLAVIVFWRTPGKAERAMFLAVVAEALVAFPLHLPATGFLAVALVGAAGCPRGDLRLERSVGGNLSDVHPQRRDQERRYAYSAG